MIWNKSKDNKTKRADTKRPTTGFTMLLIPNSTDATKTVEISFDRLLKMFTGAVAVAIIVIGLLFSMVVHNHKLKTSLEDAESSVKELRSTNTELESTVSSLNEQIAADKEVFSKIEDTISRKEEEEAVTAAAAAVPDQIPITNANALVVNDPYEGTNGGETSGIVFSTVEGAVVVAAADGVITHVDSDDNNPYYTRGIVIDHQNGYITYYRLNGDVTAKEGYAVLKGDVLAMLPTAGYVAFEIKQNGEFIEPRSLLRENQ
ncbi:MAG: peptidoglycan DD-metalloendopeptidase family protein [Lachnospiraceae bacterium]|nr:peptidoglycan DD-metalloendopeptidase family protein [Lachnospiraceae bacterium]